MSDTEIRTALREFIETNFMVATEFPDEASFLQHGIIDSLGILDLLGFIDSRYGFRPQPQDVVPENFDSLNRLTKYVLQNIETSIS